MLFFIFGLLFLRSSWKAVNSPQGLTNMFDLASHINLFCIFHIKSD